jgi:hypothetical protein
MAVVKIGKAAEILGVEVQTQRAWEKSGELIPDRRSKGGVRYYDVGKFWASATRICPRLAMLAIAVVATRPSDYSMS